MKSSLRTIVTTVIGGLILAYFTIQLNADKVDLRYTLSQKIPTSFLNKGSTESIQLLEIKNNSKTKLKDIKVKINTIVADFEVQKFSSFDTVNTIHNQDSLEIAYSSLSPDGIIKMVLKSPGMGISKSQLSIRHDKGVAKEAFSQSNNTIAAAIFYGILVVMLFFGIRLMNVDLLQWFIISDPYNKILLKKMPFYLSESKWMSLRETALKYVFDKIVFFRDIEDSLAYKILNQEKSTYLSDEEWKTLLSSATTKLNSHLIEESIRSYDYKQIERLLAIKKPANMEQKIWDDNLGKISQIYISKVISDLVIHFPTLYYSSATKYEDILKKENVGNLPDEYLNSLRKITKDIYFVKIAKLLYGEGVFPDNRENYDTDLLGEDHKKLVKEINYDVNLTNLMRSFYADGATVFLKKERPEWIQDSDFNYLQNVARELAEAKNNNEKNKILNTSFNSILLGSRLGDKQPELLSEEEWQRIKEIEHEISVQRGENQNERQKITEVQEYIFPLKDKLERQLEIINSIFSDPTILGRLEDYSNPFAPKNFENLKAIATLLHSPVNHNKEEAGEQRQTNHANEA